MKAIIATHPETGNVVTEFTSAKGNLLGKIRVDQLSPTTVNGFLSFSKRSAFITINTDQLEMAKQVLQAGAEYPVAGKIVRTESFEPQYEGHKAKIIPANGDEPAKEYLLDGRQVYFTDNWESDMSKQDVLLTSSVQVAETVESEEEA